MYTPGLGLTANRAPAALGANGTHGIFTIAGIVIITHIVGYVITTAMDATGCNLKLQHSVGVTDLCADLAIASDIVGTYYTITGTVANAMIARDLTTVGAPGTLQAAAQIMGAGTISYVNSGTQVGVVGWFVAYLPVHPGSSIVPV